MPRLRRWCALSACLLACSALAQKSEMGLDLSPEAAVKTVVVCPPLLKVTTTQGGFAGFDASKSSDKFDFAGLKKLVPGLQKELGVDKVISADATTLAITKDGVKPTQLRTPTGIARLAKAANAAWVVFLEVKQGSLTASVFNLLGESSGRQFTITNGAGLSPAQVDDLSKQLAKELVALSQPKPEEVKPVAAVVPVAPPAPPEEDVTGEVEQEIAREKTSSAGFQADPSRTRAVVAIGAGAQLRDQTVSGDASASLAELQSSASSAVAVYALLAPLQFFGKTQGHRYSDLSAELNYRRAFTTAKGVSGGLEGQTCGVTDDDLQLRGTYRYPLGAEGSLLPALGLSAGYSQERSTFSACDLPVVSAVYRGIDLQLRVKQPLYQNKVAFDLAVGPRFLLKGTTAENPGFSLAGEAWVEAKPVSVLFVRGGARLFYAQLSNAQQLSTTDLRVFLGVEAGVFF